MTRKNLPFLLLAFLMTMAVIGGLAGYGASSLNDNFRDSKEPVHPETAGHQYYEAKCDEAKSDGWLITKDKNYPSKNGSQANQQEKISPAFKPPDYCDMAAQYRSAEAAESSSRSAQKTYYWTIIGVALLFGTLFLTYGTLKEAERTTKAVIDEQRPWVRITNIDIEPGWLNFSMENKGKSAASSVKITVRQTAGSDLQWASDIDAVIEDMKTIPSNWPFSYALQPTEETDVPFPLTHAEISRFNKPYERGEWVRIFIEVMVEYSWKIDGPPMYSYRTITNEGFKPFSTEEGNLREAPSTNRYT